jgi:hypothetical protein
MSLILTYWEDPRIKNTPDDYEGILEVRLKSIKQIPELLAHMPSHCTMVSTEYSADHKNRGKISNPSNPRYFKEIWKKGQPLREKSSPKCPLCGGPKCL